jgi:large subunit ribosomal protein L21
VTAGDHVRLPFRMPNVEAGDVLRFNRASVLGSRDFTLKGSPYIDERLFECRVRVLGVDSEPMRIKEKTKRRQRHVKRVRSKHRYTLLRVMDLRVKSVDEIMGLGAEVVEDGEGGETATVEVKS